MKCKICDRDCRGWIVFSGGEMSYVTDVQVFHHCSDDCKRAVALSGWYHGV